MRNEKRHSFILYTEYREFIEDLDDRETAELFRAVMCYADGGEVSEFSDRHIRSVFKMIAKQMDRDTDKYNDICQKRREAGKKSAEARKAKAAKAEHRSANPTDNYNEDEAEDENEAENENEDFDEADNDADAPCSEGVCAEKQEENFRLFIEAYPKRTAVKEAYIVWKKIAPDDELTRRMIAAVNVQKSCSQWQEDNGRYIPKPANWLRGQRWEDVPAGASVSESVVTSFEGRRDYSDILSQALGI